MNWPNRQEEKSAKLSQGTGPGLDIAADEVVGGGAYEEPGGRKIPAAKIKRRMTTRNWICVYDVWEEGTYLDQVICSSRLPGLFVPAQGPAGALGSRRQGAKLPAFVTMTSLMHAVSIREQSWALSLVAHEQGPVSLAVI